MGSVNKVILVGNLGRDAELRYTPGGAAVATLNLATTEVWNDKSGQRQERTEWHNIDLWGKQAESLNEYLRKGKPVYIEVRLQTDEYTDKEGAKRKSTVRNSGPVARSNGRADSRTRAVLRCAVSRSRRWLCSWICPAVDLNSCNSSRSGSGP